MTSRALRIIPCIGSVLSTLRPTASITRQVPSLWRTLNGASGSGRLLLVRPVREDAGGALAIVGMHDLEDVCADQLLGRVAQHPFGRGTLIADRSVEAEQHDDVVRPLDQRAELLLTVDQLGLEAGALDRVAERARQVLAVRFALDEIVLRAVLHRGDRQVGFGRRRQHDDGNARRRREHPADGVEAGAVGQVQIEENGVEARGLQQGDRIGERAAPLDVDLRRRFRQRRAKDMCVQVVVFDEENADRLRRHPFRTIYCPASSGGSMEKRSGGTSRLARRRFLKTVPAAVAAGLAAPSLAQQAQEQRISKDALDCAEKITGIDFSDADQQQALGGVNNNLANFERLRNTNIPLDTEPAITFRPYLPGKKPKPGATPNGKVKVTTAVPAARRSSIDDLAFLPVAALSGLVRKRDVSSTELTRMYLERLKKFGPKLNCVVTLTEELALAQAAQADKEIRSGRYKGPLHGIPWGAKDLLATKGILTTWGATAYQNQVFDYDATVVERLRDAGAVLVAKLSLGALAQGDNWFRGQTKNPWNGRGSSGSSAGPGAATAAGLVGFAIGTETRGSIISPAAVNNVVGLRPTYGRVSRFGAMALSWTMDKIGPMCRSVEDCALVFNAIYGPDGRDDTVVDAPFEWNPDMPLSKLRIGYVKSEFEEQPPDGRGGARRGAGAAG